MKPVVAVMAMIALAACSSTPRPKMPVERIERVLAQAPGEAQPSKVVATELAFSRAAREDGQWTAFRRFAAPGAVIHGRNGIVEAEPWLATLDDPDEPVAWAPQAVWMSCDSQLAISLGRFQDPDGLVGSFVTVWQRQRDGDYRWQYDMGAPDDPQPPQKQDTAAVANEIVVTGLDMVEGHVADCPKRDETMPPPPALAINDARYKVAASPDGTLRWRWEHRDDGSRRVVVYILSEGEWREGFDQTWAAPAEVQS